MPFSSDSSDRRGRNVFDVPAPVFRGRSSRGSEALDLRCADYDLHTGRPRSGAKRRRERARAVARPLATAVAVLALVLLPPRC